MLFLAHKAVHAEFYPAPRHEGRYTGGTFQYPETMVAGVEGRPMWVENQRNSWHGVDFAYHANLDVGEYYKRYMETFLSVDEGLGRIVDHLEQRGELDDTLILYMSDNGFLFGEHGLIDKRCAYEESMRIPMVARCPALFGGGREIDEVVANLDIAPTMLEAAGLEAPEWMEGKSLMPLLRGDAGFEWRSELLYEYYWERNFPQTPTVHALREDRFKYVRYHGVWDIDELYDLQEDPSESRNLIFSPGHEAVVERMNATLFDKLEATGGLQMPLPRDAGERNILRDGAGPALAAFPEQLLKWLAR
jgi:N-acetylglucosamine-6-sulfatase